MNRHNDYKALTHYDYELYARHIILPQINIEGQKRLKKSKILFIGAGGLASSSLLYLNAAGVGEIGIIDDDHIQLSNLQRQILYNTEMIGDLKVISAKQELNKLNPNCKITTYNTKFTQCNRFKIIHAYDIIIDSTDNFEVRYIISQTCKILHKIHVYGAVFELQGQVSIFNYQSGPNYKDINTESNYYIKNPCNQSGIIGIVTGLIGIIQATETVKVITGLGHISNGYLLLYNSLDLSLKKIIIKSGNSYRLKPFIYFSSIKHVLSINKLHSLLKSTPELIYLIDIRNILEYKRKHFNKAINIPFKKLIKKDNIKILQQATRNRSIILYCNNSIQSYTVSGILSQANIKHFLLDNYKYK
jgi:sulfur-carrier protein adenylyltransferase/sulfurtransferase